MINPTRTLLAGLALLGLLGLSACGDTTDDSAGESPTETTASGGEGAAGEPVDCADAPGETVTVEIGDFVFEPATVTVGACDEIVWSNVHNQAHTSTGNGDVSWSTGNLAPGAEADPIAFDTPGTFSYICALHPFMEGTVEVT
jgi:plastocyanin